MAKLKGVVRQSTRLASRDGYGGHINFFDFWSDDTQAVVEAAGYITRRQLPVNYADGDVITIYGDSFTQQYTATTDASTGELTLTAVHGAHGGGAAVGSHVTITSIDFKPTGNPDEYTVETTWVDENGVTQTTTDGTPVTLSGAETTTTLVDNADKTFTYTSEDGSVTTFDATDVLTTLVDNGDGTLTYTDEVAAPQTFNAFAEVAALGDLMVGVAAGDAAPLTMGAADQYLKVNATATGLEWASASVDNLFTADLVLAANRAHDLAGFTFEMSQANNTGLRINASNAQLISQNLSSVGASATGLYLSFGAGDDLRLDGAVGNAGQAMLSQGADAAPVWGDIANSSLFLSNAAVGPGIAGDPTTVEALAAAGAVTDVVVYYNGTDIDSTDPTHAWYIDASGAIVRILSPSSGVNLFDANDTLTANRAHDITGFQFQMTGANIDFILNDLGTQFEVVHNDGTQFGVDVDPELARIGGRNGVGDETSIEVIKSDQADPGIRMYFSGAGAADLKLDNDPGLAGTSITSQGADAAPDWSGYAVIPVDTLAALPSPATVTAGSLRSVVNDGANNGVYLATGAAVGAAATTWEKQ